MNDWTLDKARNGNPPIYQYWMRKSSHFKILNNIYKIIFRITSFLYSSEIAHNAKIGPGLYIGHPFCITINPKVIIGKNCCIHKGVTIGQENRGERKGTPLIGDSVWIGVNSTIVGNITIGNDVLIAPNSFVNCDVPDHSIVYGNPCVIKHCDNATESYINITT